MENILSMIELRNNYWAVEVPEGAADFGFINDSLACKLPTSMPGRYHWLHEIEEQMAKIGGEWEIVCMSKDRKIPNGIVECKTVEYDGKVQGTRFVNYINPKQWTWFISKTKSLNSLLTSKGCDVNKNWLIIKKQK